MSQFCYAKDKNVPEDKKDHHHAHPGARGTNLFYHALQPLDISRRGIDRRRSQPRTQQQQMYNAERKSFHKRVFGDQD
jgi:hypothetical protein